MSYSKQQSRDDVHVLEEIEKSGSVCSIDRIKIISVIFDAALKTRGTRISEIGPGPTRRLTTAIPGHGRRSICGDSLLMHDAWLLHIMPNAALFMLLHKYPVIPSHPCCGAPEATAIP